MPTTLNEEMIEVTNAYSIEINVRYRFRMIYSFLVLDFVVSDYESHKLHFPVLGSVLVTTDIAVCKPASIAFDSQNTPSQINTQHEGTYESKSKSYPPPSLPRGRAIDRYSALP